MTPAFQDKSTRTNRVPASMLQPQFHGRPTHTVRLVPALIALFVVLPFVELYLLFKVVKLAGARGPEAALLLIVLTGILGGILARSQGLVVFRRLRDDLQHGKLPADALVDGALVLVGGVLLLTPGMITDTVGFVLLIPPTRKLIKKAIKERIKAHITIAGPGRQYTDAHFEVKDNQDL